jgi:hypothetical protein
MSSFRRIGTIALTAATVLLGSHLGAVAANGPTITLANNNTLLAGSTISNFDPSETLRLELSVTTGSLTIALGNSGAVVAPGGSLSGGKVAITGTEAQLNAALATTTVSQNCSATRAVSAYVVEGSNAMYLDPDNNHWYAEVVTSGDSWDTDKTNADATTLPHSTGHGYLATITSAAENTFLNNHFSDTPLIGASDAALEGDWYWMDGPEAGTKFYSGGAAVAGAYTHWNSGEPNNSNGNENYGQLWTDDTWNDIAGDNRYLVEFGGLVGDDFSGVLSASTSANLSVTSLISGSGTSSSPYLIDSEQTLQGVTTCSGAGIYFKQTADIYLDNSFAAEGTFSGFYDGNGKAIDYSAITNGASALFGTISGSGTPASTIVKDLTINGVNNAAGFSCTVGILAGTIQSATIDGVTISNSSLSTACEGGLLADSIDSSVVSNTSVNGSLSVFEFVENAGGLASRATSSQFTNDECNVTIDVSDFMPFIDMIMNTGGCVGDSSGSTYTSVVSSGGIFTGQHNHPMMVFDMRGLGGLIGTSSSDTISRSSAAMNINPQRGESVGGLVGIASGSTISTSFATGSLNPTDSQNVGGLIGQMQSATLTDSYTTGAITNGGPNTGSLVGDVDAGSSVASSYSLGTVALAAGGSSHGLIGVLNGGTVASSYWKIATGGIDPTTESTDRETPKYSGELKNIATFAGWNISASPTSQNAWAICSTANGGYPYLAWQSVPGGCTRSFVSGATASISGVAYVGSTVAATAAAWDPLATLSYQWYAGANAVSGATSASLVITPNLKGELLSVKITGAKDGYNSLAAASAATKVADVPKTSVLSVGGFKAKSSTVPAATLKAIGKLLTNSGTALTLKCEGFATAKKLTAAQLTLATARATAVCNAIGLLQPGIVGTKSTSLAKKSDKFTEGVRVTITAVKP